jgi:hypothetical protein
MWDTNQLGKTKAFVEKLQRDLADFSRTNALGVKLEEDYAREPRPDGHHVTFGLGGAYKGVVDDSYAIERSLEPVLWWALAGIVAITLVFFRKWAPTVIVVSGMVMGTVITMGFTYLVFGELNMITSILGAILAGFGIDYGIHFVFRTRLELGAGKPYDVAVHDALLNAGRPALVSAVVTAGSFFVLVVSEFRGFSQFGFLAGCGTLIIAFTLFSWSPALLVLLGRLDPTLPERLVGTMRPPPTVDRRGSERRIPRPGLVLALCTLGVGSVCAFAIPWKAGHPASHEGATLLERLQHGIRFNYNTRALLPEGQASVRLGDEISERFGLSSDPIAVYTPTLEEAKEVYDELTLNKHKYPSVEQVASVYSFVPPPETARANRRVLDAWQEELAELDVAALPPQAQEKAALFRRMLEAQPFDVHGVPDIYASQFRHLPSTRPENHGWLTFIYPAARMADGRNLMAFAAETAVIHTASGKEFRSAGSHQLYAKLARIVLSDGRLTVVLAVLWILLMHYADFRNVKLALASVLPLGVGLLMMLGLMSMANERLNFMNIIMLPILLGFGVSHGLYLLHRYLEGTSPLVALRSVGAAVASSTLTAICGFAALFAASHNGLRTMGLVSVIGLTTTLVVSFTVLAAVLQLMHDGRSRARARVAAPAGGPEAVPLSSEQQAA